MDVALEATACVKPVFTDYALFKKRYAVLESWEEIERAILGTYDSPARQRHGDSDPDEATTASSYAPFWESLAPAYYAQSKEALANSLEYATKKYGHVYYVRIRNNALAMFSVIHVRDFRNPLAKWVRKAVPRAKQSHPKLDRWMDYGGIIRENDPEFEEFFVWISYNETRFLFGQLCNGQRALPDCDFLINPKERLTLKQDLSEASEELVGAVDAPLRPVPPRSAYVPILGFNWNERYADFPLPTPDDVLRGFRIFAAPNCNNPYLEVDQPPVPWEDKFDGAFFRGSLTGASVDWKRNVRLRLLQWSKGWRPSRAVPEADVGLTHFAGYRRYRKHMEDAKVHRLPPTAMDHLDADWVSLEDQRHYKYVFYAEGNVAAFRGAALFSFGSVVLWIRSPKYHLWFEPLLQDWVHCVFVESDLSNLPSVLRRLHTDDALAKGIAANARAFYDTHLRAEHMLAYTQAMLQFLCRAE